MIVNTARGTVGENAAALIGSTLLNLVTLGVAEQARLEPEARRPISMFVDEFHTIPGADYEGILAELSKYGANLVLATQSLARLLAIGQEEGRGLRATVFANLDGTVRLQLQRRGRRVSGAELGGALDEQDLVELGEHQCYVRLSSRGKRCRRFRSTWTHRCPPIAQMGAALARASAAVSVETRRSWKPTAALSRARQRRRARRHVQAAIATPASPGRSRRRRNQHRAKKKRRQPEIASATSNSS